MLVTKNIHTLEIPFQIPLAPDKQISRSVSSPSSSVKTLP